MSIKLTYLLKHFGIKKVYLVKTIENICVSVTIQYT